MTLPGSGCQGCRGARLDFDFTMAFQPVIDVVDHRIDGHEALVRGTGGEGAGAVLSRVNGDNLYAFDQACRVRAIEMAAALGLEGRLNINFLPNAVYEPRACIRATLDAAARTGFPLDRLTFEITENEPADEAHLLRIVQEYRKHGFRIALDDFTTGYSGLSRLANLRPDIVKLDRAVVQDCHQDPLRLAIVASVASLGRETGIKVVAEGVEREEEVRALRGAGIRFMQGFLLCRPLFREVAGPDRIHWPEPEAVPA